MKLADFLSDKSKQALNEIRKYYSEESIDKQDYAAESNDDEQTKEIAKPTRKVDRRIEWQAKKKKKAELRQRLKEKKEAYILAKETERICRGHRFEPDRPYALSKCNSERGCFIT